jgi:peroxiredoxin Q/BCP
VTEVSKLEVGQAAPDFTLTNDKGQKVKLSQFKGEKVILFFFPAALTPGCTKEACEFNDSLNSFKSAGYTVIGISPDSVEKLAKFREKEHLNYELLSDEDKEVHKSFGAFGEKSLYGRLYTGVLRSTFALDENGKIVLAGYNVKATGHVAKIKKELGLAD